MSWEIMPYVKVCRSMRPDHYVGTKKETYLSYLFIHACAWNYTRLLMTLAWHELLTN